MSRSSQSTVETGQNIGDEYDTAALSPKEQQHGPTAGRSAHYLCCSWIRGVDQGTSLFSEGAPLLSPLDTRKGIPSAPDHGAINESHDLWRKSTLNFGLDALLELGPIFNPEDYGRYPIHRQGVSVG